MKTPEQWLTDFKPNDCPLELIKQVMQQAREHAFEEAAQIAQSDETDDPKYIKVLDEVAADIRALKNKKA